MRRIVFLGFLYCVFAYSELDTVLDEFRVQKLSPVRSEFAGHSDIKPGHDAFKGSSDDKIAISSFKNGENAPGVDDHFRGIPSLTEDDRDERIFIDDPIANLLVPEIANIFQERYEDNEPNHDAIDDKIEISSLKNDEDAPGSDLNFRGIPSLTEDDRDIRIFDDENYKFATPVPRKFPTLKPNAPTVLEFVTPVPRKFPTLKTKASGNYKVATPVPRKFSTSTTIDPTVHEFATPVPRKFSTLTTNTPTVHKFATPVPRQFPTSTTNSFDVSKDDDPGHDALNGSINDKIGISSSKNDENAPGSDLNFRGIPSLTEDDRDISISADENYKFATPVSRKFPTLTTKASGNYKVATPVPRKFSTLTTNAPTVKEFATTVPRKFSTSTTNTPTVHKFATPVPRQFPTSTTNASDVSKDNDTGHDALNGSINDKIGISSSKNDEKTKKNYDKFCDVRVDGFYRHIVNCSQIIQCFGGEAFEYPPCSNNLGFDERTGVCNYRNQVEGCSNAHFAMGKKLKLQSTQSPLAAIVDANSRNDDNNAPVAAVNSNSGVTDENCGAGRSHGDHISVVGDCASFYRCVWGQKVLMNCPSGTLFNSDLDVCDFPNNVACS